MAHRSGVPVQPQAIVCLVSRTACGPATHGSQAAGWVTGFGSSGRPLVGLAIGCGGHLFPIPVRLRPVPPWGRPVVVARWGAAPGAQSSDRGPRLPGDGASVVLVVVHAVLLLGWGAQVEVTQVQATKRQRRTRLR